MNRLPDFQQLHFGIALQTLVASCVLRSDTGADLVAALLERRQEALLTWWQFDVGCNSKIAERYLQHNRFSGHCCSCSGETASGQNFAVALWRERWNTKHNTKHKTWRMAHSHDTGLPTRVPASASTSRFQNQHYSWTGLEDSVSEHFNVSIIGKCSSRFVGIVLFFVHARVRFLRLFSSQMAPIGYFSNANNLLFTIFLLSICMFGYSLAFLLFIAFVTRTMAINEPTNAID